MIWQETPYTIPLLVEALISITLGLYIWWRFRRSWAVVGALLILASAEWTLGYALELGSATLPAKIFWNKMQFIGIVIIPVSWFIYMLHYTGHEKWVTRRNVALLSIVPGITLLLAFNWFICSLYRKCPAGVWVEPYSVSRIDTIRVSCN